MVRKERNMYVGDVGKEKQEKKEGERGSFVNRGRVG